MKHKSTVAHLSGSNSQWPSSEPKLYLFGNTAYCRTKSQPRVDHSCSSPVAALNLVATQKKKTENITYDNIMQVRSRNSWRKKKETDHVRVYLVRLRGGGGLRGCRWFWLPVGVLRRGLVALIGWVRSRDHRPGRLDRSGRVGGRHSMSYSWGLLDAVAGCRGVGVRSGRLSAEKRERWEKGAVSLRCSIFRARPHVQDKVASRVKLLQ